jgi:hypothetical protein
VGCRPPSTFPTTAFPVHPQGFPQLFVAILFILNYTYIFLLFSTIYYAQTIFINRKVSIAVLPSESVTITFAIPILPAFTELQAVNAGNTDVVVRPTVAIFVAVVAVAALKLATSVVEVTTRGAVPVAIVDVNCPVTERLVPVASPMIGEVSVGVLAKTIAPVPVVPLERLEADALVPPVTLPLLSYVITLTLLPE